MKALKHILTERKFLNLRHSSTYFYVNIFFGYKYSRNNKVEMEIYFFTLFQLTFIISCSTSHTTKESHISLLEICLTKKSRNIVQMWIQIVDIFTISERILQRSFKVYPKISTMFTTHSGI